jgi:hypothetical protein
VHATQSLAPFGQVAQRLSRSNPLAAALHPNDLLPPWQLGELSTADAERCWHGLLRSLEEGLSQPARAAFVDAPKTRSTTRPAALLTFPDRCLLEGLVANLMPAVERAIPPPSQVFWPRGGPSADRSHEFDRTPLAHDAQYVVKADIADFYASIEHESLREILDQATGLRLEAGAIAALLSEVMGGHRGIPQGLSAPHTLGTAYLLPADRSIFAAWPGATRYGDDYLVPAPSRASAESALRDLECELAHLGLALRCDKSSIVTRQDYERSLRAPAGRRSDTPREAVARLRALAEVEPKRAAAIAGRRLAATNPHLVWERSWLVHVLTVAGSTHAVDAARAIVASEAEGWLPRVQAAALLWESGDLDRRTLLVSLWKRCPDPYRPFLCGPADRRIEDLFLPSGGRR